MPVHSAAVLPWLGEPTRPQVLVGHMGGPFWARKDEAAWSLFKGEFDPQHESAEAAARREFTEETGLPLAAPLQWLGEFRVTSAKQLHVFTCRADGPWDFVASNTFAMEWPPRSGRMQDFPEMDRAAWLDLDQAERALVKGQRPILAALLRALTPG